MHLSLFCCDTCASVILAMILFDMLSHGYSVRLSMVSSWSGVSTLRDASQIIPTQDRHWQDYPSGVGLLSVVCPILRCPKREYTMRCELPFIFGLQRYLDN
jgi:hypothetical protein